MQYEYESIIVWMTGTYYLCYLLLNNSSHLSQFITQRTDTEYVRLFLIFLNPQSWIVKISYQLCVPSFDQAIGILTGSNVFKKNRTISCKIF